MSEHRFAPFLERFVPAVSTSADSIDCSHLRHEGMDERPPFFLLGSILKLKGKPNDIEDQAYLLNPVRDSGTRIAY